MALGDLYCGMSKLLLMAALVAAAMAKVTMAASTMEERHSKWMAEHGRTYRDAAEKARRFRAFKANVELIDRSNAAAGKRYRLATNRFTDLTNAEFAAIYTGYKPSTMPPSSSGAVTFMYANATLSSEDQQPAVDWRQQGAVTGVKNQGPCGCCWAFSTVAAVEGIHQITTGELVSLSEQQLLDCSDNGGCSGGSLDKAFQYMANSGGVTTEDAYPYQAQQGTCQFDGTSAVAAATISGYQRVNPNDEAALAAAVANQPVSVAIEGSSPLFQHYSSGVFTADSCGTTLNHAVTMVGYGAAADGSAYWLIKNSWGATWGEGGYMKLEKDVGSSQGACGVAMAPSYPVV
ncbi:ervatamin-B-like [Oryza brachyantha]|uniref:ervatamin-B-like n=1 Tax=Oryza brachyantha TaxID=4533 RepID=UPI001ADAE71D|nr:ervatamin-B-like [Oryza brachyantha]